jgi:hypothetical protein
VRSNRRHQGSCLRGPLRIELLLEAAPEILSCAQRTRAIAEAIEDSDESANSDLVIRRQRHSAARPQCGIDPIRCALRVCAQSPTRVDRRSPQLLTLVLYPFLELDGHATEKESFKQLATA